MSETYEGHWPHSTIGAATPLTNTKRRSYDGVSYHLASVTGDVDTAKNSGAQAQNSW